MYHRPSRQTIVLMHFHPSKVEAHMSSQVVHQPLDGSRHSLIMTVIGIRIVRMILSLTMAETYSVKRGVTSLGVVLLSGLGLIPSSFAQAEHRVSEYACSFPKTQASSCRISSMQQKVRIIASKYTSSPFHGRLPVCCGCKIPYKSLSD